MTLYASPYEQGPSPTARRAFIITTVAGLRGEERFAAACIQAALPGVQVEQHDDGSKPSMHDLALVRDGHVFAAVEVTAAADQASIELWNLVNGTNARWIERSLAGGWMVGLLPHARAKDLRRQLPRLLGELEALGIDHLRRASPGLQKTAHALRVSSATQGGTDFPGSIYLTIHLPAERSGAFLPPNGDPLVEWANDWVGAPEQAHNISKLVSSPAKEKHLFVLLPGFTEAPSVVADLLIRDDAPLPSKPPTLPAGVTHFWVLSTWDSGHGLRWSTGGWAAFEKVEVVG